MPNIITCIPLCFNFQTLELFVYPLELYPYPLRLKYPRLRAPAVSNLEGYVSVHTKMLNCNQNSLIKTRWGRPHKIMMIAKTADSWWLDKNKQCSGFLCEQSLLDIILLYSCVINIFVCKFKNKKHIMICVKNNLMFLHAALQTRSST